MASPLSRLTRAITSRGHTATPADGASPDASAGAAAQQQGLLTSLRNQLRRVSDVARPRRALERAVELGDTARADRVLNPQSRLRTWFQGDVDVNQAAPGHPTYLQAATMRDDPDMVQRLLNRGAGGAEEALALAQELGHDGTATVLRAHLGVADAVAEPEAEQLDAEQPAAAASLHSRLSAGEPAAEQLGEERPTQPVDVAPAQSHLSASQAEPDPIQWTPRSAMSVIHGRPVRALATNREPAVGG